MTSAPDRPAVRIYKKTYFGASRTWDVWNKLTASQVFDLTEQPGFEGQNVYFHGNHPIRYVYLCGIVQQVDFAGGIGANKFALLSLDDGSGRVIEAKIIRRHGQELDQAEYPSNTMIDNLDVQSTWGLASILVDKEPVPVGSILKVKGTITKFRERQIELKRAFRVKNTNEEVAFWASMAKYRRDVLSRPWVLTEAEMRQIDEDIAADERRERERKIERKEKYAKHEHRKARHDEKREKQRKMVEQVLNEGALAGSNIIRAPWES